MTGLASAASRAGGDGVATTAPHPLTLSRYYAKLRSPLLTSGDAERARSEARYELRAHVSGDHRVPALVPGKPTEAETRRHTRHRECGVEVIGETADVRVVDGRGYWTGLETCGDANCCAVCAAKVRSRRAVRLRDGIARWADRGGSVSLATLTVAHDPGDKLAHLLRVEAEGWHKITSGASYQRLKARLGIVGTVTTTEVTHGYNGWHPHQHNLVFHDRRWDVDDWVVFRQHAYLRWRKVCKANGLREPDSIHGIDIQMNCDTTEIGSYVAKLQEGDWSVADEVTRGDVKTGRSAHRTPFEILRAYYATGEFSEWLLWCEYVTAIKGKPVCRWSRGLIALVFAPADEPEKTDAELALDDVGGDLVARCPPHVFARVRGAGLQLLVTYAAESGGLPAVNALLAEYGCGWALPPISEGPSP